MRQLIVVAGLLLGSTAAFAQNTQKTASASTTPTTLPGEEKLSARERAERDFIMPARRKQDALLRAAREDASEAEATGARPDEADVPNESAVAAPAAPAAPRRTYHRRATSHRTTAASKRKVVHKSASASKRKQVTRKPAARKTTARKPATRRRR